MNNNNNTKIIELLAERVYNDLAETQIQSRLLELKPLMTPEQISEHINNHLDDYLSADEKKQLILEQTQFLMEVIEYSINKDIDYVALKVAIKLKSVYLKETIRKIIEKKSVGIKKFKQQHYLRLLFLSKSFKENHVTKFDVRDAPEDCPF